MMTHEPVNTTVSGPTGWIRSVWCRAGIPLACGWRLALVVWFLGSTVLGQTVPTNDEPSNPIEVNTWAPVLSGEGTGATYGLEDTPDMRVAFTSMGATMGFVNGGRLRALAVSSARRVASIASPSRPGSAPRWTR